MLLRFYSFLVLCWDLTYVVFGCMFAILEACYHAIRPPKGKSVYGEAVLIVGAGRGIGKELALQFAVLGARVVCWDIDAVANKSTVNSIHRMHVGTGKIFAYTCDVSDREQVLKVGAVVKREVGDVTIIIHCCGVPSPRSLITKPVPDIRKTFDVTIISHFWLLEVFLPRMIELNSGHIVALTSVAGLTGLRDQVPLCASQFAVQGLIEALSEELRTTKVSNRVHLTLVHIYPFIMTSDQARDIRLRIPSYFGSIDPRDAARQIITGMRRNYWEMSIPGYLLYLGKLLRVLPRKASVMLRELLDTGVDFG